MADDSLRIADDFPPVSREGWRALIDRELKGAPYEALRSKLEGRLPIEPLYEGEPVPDARLGMPGLPPFIRGSAG
ncbi:MAG: methylmalonyl-CoA mutase, partial [Polyangiaceae bacterium]|nr:methylmalonyl-CoA mutase [Polyangiaceae bacterium]